jgi:hypothetical protein
MEAGDYLALCITARRSRTRRTGFNPLPSLSNFNLVIFHTENKLVETKIRYVVGHAEERSLIVDVVDYIQPKAVHVIDANFWSRMLRKTISAGSH